MIILGEIIAFFFLKKKGLLQKTFDYELVQTQNKLIETHTSSSMPCLAHSKR